MKKTILIAFWYILFFWFLFLAQGGEAKEGECKNPIFLSAFEVDPTILILLDNSDSMNITIPPTIESGYKCPGGEGGCPDKWLYDPNTTYPGPFKGELKCKEDNWYVLGEREPNKWICAYFVKNDYTTEDPAQWEGWYSKNYLNWLLTTANIYEDKPWKSAGEAKFYIVTLKRVNASKTPEIPRFLEDLTDENGIPLLKEPWKDDKTDYYWFDDPHVPDWNFSWSEWYKYWYRKPASRMNIARYVTNDLIRTDWKKLFNLDIKFRYGLMVFRRHNDSRVVIEDANLKNCESAGFSEVGPFIDIDRGGELLVRCGSISTTKDHVDLSHIKDIEEALRTRVISDKYTPLAESLYEAGMYFIGSDTKFCVTRLDGSEIKRKLVAGTVSAWGKYGAQNMGIESWCQDNSILLITDGYPTYDTEVPPFFQHPDPDHNYTNADFWRFDYDGDGNEPPYFHELIKKAPWNEGGIECNKLGSKTMSVEGCTESWCSHYLDDVIKYLGGSSTDLISGTGIKAGPMGDERQYINTYIVGFQYNSPFLRESAEANKCSSYYGTECIGYNPNNYFNLKETEQRYFSATNPTNLKDYLSDIIEDIIKRTSSSVAVAVSISVSESRSEDYIVRARFDPKGWRGFIEAFQLPYCSGVNKDKLGLDDKTGKIVCKQLPVWEGGARLGTETREKDDSESWRDLDADNKDRDIYTYNVGGSPQKVEFKKDNISSGSWLYNALRGTSTLDVDQVKALVSWVRGEYRDEEFLPTKYPKLLDERAEGWRLFDIVYSTPIVLGAPNAWYGTDSVGTNTYNDFAKGYKNRERMAFVGSNLGMLHAFKLTTDCKQMNAQGSCTEYETDHQKSGGWEKWAYIPSNLLPYLKDKAEPRHCRFSGVDLGLVKTDIFMDFDGNSDTWGTVLVGGEREGGSNYFCLNITDSNIMTMSPIPATKTILWEYSNPAMLGDSISYPEIGIVRKNKAGTEVGSHWVAFLTTSTNSTSGIPYIIPLDIATGRMFDVNGDTLENDQIEVTGATLPLTSACAMDDFTDKKFDDLIDTIYFADAKGKVWKMTVGSSSVNGPDDNDWKPYVIFEAKDDNLNPQPISVPISVAFTKNYRVILFFGTGKYENKNDISSTQTQTFYCLIDNKIKYNETNPLKIIDKATNLDILEFKFSETKPECKTDPITGEYKFPGVATRTTVKTTNRTYDLGWYINFNLKGCAPPGLPNNETYWVSERVTEPPLIYADKVFFTSFIPTTQPCSAGGIGYIHAVNYETGEPPEKEVLVGTGMIEKSYITSIYLGEGVPSRAVIDPTSNQLFVQMSDKGEIMIIKIGTDRNPIHILNWCEEGFAKYKEK